MADPVNWLICELVVLAVVGGVTLLVTIAAARQAKSYGISGK